MTVLEDTLLPAPTLVPRRSTIAATLAAAILLGCCTAVSPGIAFGVLALPALAVLIVGLPELLLILFLTAGVYKEDPRIATVFPFDITVAVGAMLALAVLIRFLRRPVCVPSQAWLLIPMLLVLALGVLRPASAYGADKALRFCTLTFLAIVAGVLLLDRRERLLRFLLGLAVLGFLASLDALRSQNSTEWGRLTANGSSPIALGRLGALAFAFGWLRLHFSRNLFDKLAFAGVLLVSAACALASGSRGPVVGMVASMLLVSTLSWMKHRRSPIAIGPLLVIGALGLLLFTFVSGPELPLRRFQLLFDEQKGASVLVRGFLYATAFKQMLLHPLGIGVGGFERFAVLDLRYPHNLLLEVGCELGWLPLLTTMSLIAWSLRSLLRTLWREYTWHGLFLTIVVLTSVANSMVSGDLNDNRLLFAVLLLPFVYERIQASETLTRSSVPGHERDARVGGEL